MVTTVETYAPAPLQPAQNPEEARTLAGTFGISLTLAKGTVVAKKTSDSKMYAYAGTNRVQTYAITGTLSAGGYRLRFLDKDGKEKVTPLIAYNANIADIQTAIDAVIPQVSAASVVVAGGTAQTATTLTFSGTGYAALSQTLVEILPDGLTGMTGSTVTDTTTLTGLETPAGILMYDVKTDADGNHFYSDTSAVASSSNPANSSAPYFIAGTFDPTELTGWTSAVATLLGARTLPNGYVRIP